MGGSIRKTRSDTYGYRLIPTLFHHSYQSQRTREPSLPISLIGAGVNKALSAVAAGNLCAARRHAVAFSESVVVTTSKAYRTSTDGSPY